jgi:hypothetical protein
MEKRQPILNTVLRAVAMAMGVAVIVMSILGVTEASTLIMLLGIGLFAIGLDALNRN